MRDSQLAHRLKPYLFGTHGPAAFKDVYRGVDVTDHGADPTGVADSQAAIQAALDSLKPTGGSVFFPPGTYRLGIGLLIPLIEYTGGPLFLTGYGATLDYAGSGRAIELGTNCSGLIAGPPDNAYQYAERSAHLAGLSIQGTGAAECGVYFNGATHCSLRDLSIRGFSSVADGRAAIVLFARYYHWNEQNHFEHLDLDDGGHGFCFDMDTAAGPPVPGGSNMNNSFTNIHVWLRAAGGKGFYARQPLQWLGRNHFANIVVHPAADNCTAFDLGTAYLRGTSFVSCALDVYGVDFPDPPTGSKGWVYDGDDPLTIIAPQDDPPGAGVTDADLFSGTSEGYHIVGHRNRFRTQPSGWTTLANYAAAGESLGFEVFAGGAGAVATLGAYGAGDGVIHSKLRLGSEEAGHLWEFDHRQDFPDRFALNYWDGAAWANAFAVYPDTLDLIAGGHLVTKVYAGAPSETPDNGALAVDDVAHALYFRSGGAWYSAAGGGGGLPPGGTTAQFLRGDGAWSDTLAGGLNVGSASGATAGQVRVSGDYRLGSAVALSTPGTGVLRVGDLSGTWVETMLCAGAGAQLSALSGGWVNIPGGLNLGAAAGAAAGEVRASAGAQFGADLLSTAAGAWIVGTRTAGVLAQATDLRSNVNANSDTSGGAYLRLYSDDPASAPSGRIEIVAYGQGTGPAGNAIRFFSRSGAGAVAERIRMFSSGGLALGTFTDPGAGSLLVGGGLTVGGGNGILLNGGVQRVNFNAMDGSGGYIGRHTGSGNLELVSQGNISLGSVGASPIVHPAADNAYALGTSGVRWTAVWAVNGTIQTSLRAAKTDLAPLDPGHALAAALATPIYRFTYKSPEPERGARRSRHIGFMADEVDPLLSLDGENVSPQSTAALALASVQALHARIAELERKLEAYGREHTVRGR